VIKGDYLWNGIHALQFAILAAVAAAADVNIFTASNAAGAAPCEESSPIRHNRRSSLSLLSPIWLRARPYSYFVPGPACVACMRAVLENGELQNDLYVRWRYTLASVWVPAWLC